MEKTEIQAKDYQTREELDNFVTLNKDKISRIVGTAEELARLKLSNKNTIWDVPCETTGVAEESPPVFPKPERGEVFKHGINLKDKENKNG